MSLVGKLKKSIKYLSFRDAGAPLLFLLILLPVFFFKIYLKVTKKMLWLICEGENDAKDNGYVLFEHIRKNHPDINAHYAINSKSAAFKKVSKLGNTVNFGSIKHWIYYLSASKNISNHKASSPNAPLFYVLHKYQLVRGNRIFLQHGITMNDVKFLHYSETKFDFFLCGAKPEYDYVLKNFGYSSEKVELLGFPRFDKLWGVNVNNKQIVIMPTWRNWLGRETNSFAKNQSFTKTTYFKKYQQLINNHDFIDFVESNGIQVYFYPHVNMQRFIGEFSTQSDNIQIVTEDTADVQKLIAESGLMVSDYSSVTLDFAYMHKPVIYYQFDQAEFREKQYAEGYFNYEKMGFGPVVKSEKLLVESIIKSFNSNLAVEDQYLKNSNSFFTLRDAENSERVFRKILDMDGYKK